MWKPFDNVKVCLGTQTGGSAVESSSSFRLGRRECSGEKLESLNVEAPVSHLAQKRHCLPDAFAYVLELVSFERDVCEIQKYTALEELTSFRSCCDQCLVEVPLRVDEVSGEDRAPAEVYKRNSARKPGVLGSTGDEQFECLFVMPDRARKVALEPREMAEQRVRLREIRGVLEPARDGEILLEMAPCDFQLSLHHGELPGCPERFRSSSVRPAQGQRLSRPALALREPGAVIPERVKRAGQAKRDVGVARRDGRLVRDTQVVEVRLEASRRLRFFHAARESLLALGEREKVPRVFRYGLVRVAALLEPFGSELADRLEHPEALLTGAAGPATEEALV